jgi:hypothetical protein
MNSVASEPAQPAQLPAENVEGNLSPTPYLDRRLALPQANPRYRPIRPWQTAVILALFVLRTPLEIYLLVLAVIFFHEVGHCLAALLVGLGFNDIRVGPMAVDSCRRISWNWNWWAIMSGHAGIFPKGGSLLPLRLAVFVVAGPLANVAGGVLILRLMPKGDSTLAGFAELFTATSFLLAFVNLIPVQHAGFSSDGLRLCMLVSPKKRRRWIFLLNRQAAITRGEDVPEVQTNTIPTAVADGTSDHVHANWAAYLAANGKGNHQLAAQHLEICLSQCSSTTPDFREELILAAARFQATCRRRMELAWEWFNSSNPKKAEINRACTEALLLYYEGKRIEALAKVADGERLVAGLPLSPLRSRQERAWRKLRVAFEQSGQAIEAGSTDTHPSGAQP